MHAWENCKENVMPTRRGRAISKIVKMTKPESRSQKELKLEKEREAFESQLKDIEGHPEPILLWTRYVKWIEANYPKGDLVRMLAPVLERATQSLMETDRYTEDKRCLRLWIRYADIDKSREMEIFNFLDNKSYFSTLSLFYIARAVVAEKNGNVRLADDTYKLGINRGAEPLDKLKSRKRHFERRMARRWLDQKNKEEDDNTVSAAAISDTRQETTSSAGKEVGGYDAGSGLRQLVDNFPECAGRRSVKPLRERPVSEDGVVPPYCADKDESQSTRRSRKSRTSKKKRTAGDTKKKIGKRKSNKQMRWAFKRSDVGTGVSEMSFEELRAARYAKLFSPELSRKRESAVPHTTETAGMQSAVIGRRLSFSAGLTSTVLGKGSNTATAKPVIATGAAAASEAARCDSDDVTINTKNVLRDLADAFASPSVSWGGQENDNDVENKSFKVGTAGSTFAIFADDTEIHPPPVSKLDDVKTPFAIFADAENGESPYAAPSPVIGTRHVDPENERDDDACLSDQENAPPAGSCASRSDRPFRTLDTEEVRQSVLQPLPLPKAEEERDDVVSAARSPRWAETLRLRTDGSHSNESYNSPVRIKSPPQVHRVIRVSSAGPLSKKKDFSYASVHQQTSSPAIRRASKNSNLRRRTASPAAFKDLVRGLYEDGSDDDDSDDENGGNTVDVKAALALLDEDDDTVSSLATSPKSVDSKTTKEIKSAYRALAFKYHPDRPGGAKERFQDLREAYEALTSGEEIKVEDRLFEDLKDAVVVHKNIPLALSAWESILNRGMPVDQYAFVYLFEALRTCEDRCVLEELERATDRSVLVCEAEAYNDYLSTLSDEGKAGIDRAMEVIQKMDALGLEVDQTVARRVFSYMSGVS
eukprot:g2054.t1